jgi:hypothetical protein
VEETRSPREGVELLDPVAAAGVEIDFLEEHDVRPGVPDETGDSGESVLVMGTILTSPVGSAFRTGAVAVCDIPGEDLEPHVSL